MSKKLLLPQVQICDDDIDTAIMKLKSLQPRTKTKRRDEVRNEADAMVYQTEKTLLI